MKNLDRRELLRAGIVLSIPVAGLPLFGGCQNSTDTADKQKGDSAENAAKQTKTPNEKDTEEKEEPKMQIQYLEIVTTDVAALCKQYAAAHGITFGEPVPNLGNARTAELSGGGMIAIRGPLREDETPVIRPYILVDDIAKAVAAAKEAGAEVAIESMEIPEHGTIAIVIQGGIECGFWKSA